MNSVNNIVSDKEVFFYGESPGRLDVMGGIADYSGSLVLQMPIKGKASVKLRLRNDYLIKISSNYFLQDGYFEMSLKDILEEDGSVNYKNAHLKLKKNKNGFWASYLVGCILVFMAEENIDFRGAEIILESEVPPGKGVSSSAAIEMATLKALKEAFGLKVNDSFMPIYGQKAENVVVGAPCGLMDQLASYYGKEGYIIPILCQPDKLFPLIKIPEGVHFIGFDSGVKHSVSGEHYSGVRTAAFMGYTIIALEYGCKIEDIKEAYHSKDWSHLPFGGYLANVNTQDFEHLFLEILPEKISGREFQKEYGAIIDHVSEINPEIIYYIRNCTAHPIYENERIKRFLAILKKIEHFPDKKISFLSDLGELMFHSHKSYSACGLGHSSTDQIVDMIRKKGPSDGVFGGRITGGGSGGTVCVLAYEDYGLETLNKIKVDYEAKIQKTLSLIN